MKNIRLSSLTADIPVFSDEKLCPRCSHPEDDGGCFGCNVFNKEENKNFTGGEYYFDRIICAGEYHLSKKDKHAAKTNRDNLTKLILAFKKNEKYVAPCAELIKLKIDEFRASLGLEKTAFICAVPDLQTEKYKKGEILAKKVSEITGIPFVQVLVKTKETAKQHDLHSIKEKFDNVRGVFEISEDHKNKLNKQSIIITDDVVTSIATLNACAKVLKENGAGKIFIFAIGRSRY